MAVNDKHRVRALLDESNARVKLVRMGKALSTVLSAIDTSDDASKQHDQYSSGPHYSSYQDYVDSKVSRVNGLHQGSRRRALSHAELPALKNLLPPDPEPNDESTRTKLIRAVNKAIQLRRLKMELPHVKPAMLWPKNGHLAYEELMKSERCARQGRTCTNTTTPMIDEAMANKHTKVPLRYGDMVCFISMSSQLPLAMKSIDRAYFSKDNVTSPSMAFSIVDFRNPSRIGPVRFSESFWIRLHPDCAIGNRKSKSRGQLTETQYYLGAPGSLNIEEGVKVTIPSGRHRGSHVKRMKSKSRGSKRRPISRAISMAFKLVAMKANVPRSDMYGDDAATRAFTIESNESVSRLAKWNFIPVQVPASLSSKMVSAIDPEDIVYDEGEDLLLNCEIIRLRMHNYFLEVDDTCKRVVVRECKSTRGGSEPDKHNVPVESLWQVRLLRHEPSTFGSNLVMEEEVIQEAKWFRHQRDKLRQIQASIEEKGSTLQDVKHSNEKVWKQSNGTFAQLERAKLEKLQTYVGVHPTQQRPIHPSCDKLHLPRIPKDGQGTTCKYRRNTSNKDKGRLGRR